MKCLFCNFIKGKSTSNHPFIPLHTTPNTISFLSVDIPAREDGHIIITPKKHIKSLDETPPKILTELMSHAKKAVKKLRISHGGANILINDGRAAGQYINHLHLHIIPRDKNDNIKIEQWKPKKLTEEQYTKLAKKLTF